MFTSLCRTESKIHCRSKNETEFFWTLLTMLNLVIRLRPIEMDLRAVRVNRCCCVLKCLNSFSPFFHSITFNCLHRFCFTTTSFWTPKYESKPLASRLNCTASASRHFYARFLCVCVLRSADFLLSSPSSWIGWVFNLSNSIYNVCVGCNAVRCCCWRRRWQVWNEEKKRKAFQLLLLGANIFSRVRLPLPLPV